MDSFFDGINHIIKTNNKFQSYIIAIRGAGWKRSRYFIVNFGNYYEVMDYKEFKKRYGNRPPFPMRTPDVNIYHPWL